MISSTLANSTTPPLEVDPATSGSSTKVFSLSDSTASSNFSDTLSAAIAAQSSQSTPISSPPSAAEAKDSFASSSDPAARARRALQLDAPDQSTAPAGGGDAILDGIQKLRNVFGKEVSSLAATNTNISSSEGLFRVQAVAAEFSLFMDVSSKLAGKASQVFESLLKGQ